MNTPIVVDPGSVPSLDEADRLVREGLPGAADRLDEANLNETFYQLRNAREVERREAEDELSFQRRPKRTSKLTRCVIRKLGDPLYNPGPIRRWEGDATVDAFLQGFYADCAANTRMQQADRAAMLNHVAALQIEATGDPRRPLRVWLWKGHEFEVFCADGDPCTPYAVATMDTVPGPERGTVLTRYRLWSASERRTYLSAPWTYMRGSGGQRFRIGGQQVERLVESESGPSPYPGVLPFVFVRAEPPECDFWSGGIGTALRECNKDLDRALSDLAQHVDTFLNPVRWARNISILERFSAPVGTYVHLKPDPAIRAGTMAGEPEIGALQHQLAVEAAWYDLKTYADTTLEELEVPLTVVRTDDPRDLSGVAIQAKAAPLVARTRARQPQFSETEAEFAAVALAVAGIWYGQGRLLVAATDPKLVTVWPEPRVLETSTAEGLQALQTELDLGLTDPIEALARTRGVTLDQAVELAEQIALRRRRWRELMGGLIESDDREDRSDARRDEGEGEGEGEGGGEGGGPVAADTAVAAAGPESAS